MFSGKSSELMNRIRQYRLLDKNILVITHSCDKRYSTKNELVSHNMLSEPATSVERLHTVLPSLEYDKCSVICIDEAQFFEDLYDFVRYAVDHDEKHVIVAGLDGNFKREPFKQVVSLIPFADAIVKMNALCLACKDGTLAPFTKKRADTDKAVIDVGGAEKYQPVCRKHFVN